MKRICSLLLALTLAAGALLSFGGCSSSPRVEDVYDRVVELVEASYELNTVFYGAGLPVYEADSLYAEFSNMYYGFEYEGSHESVTPYSKFATVQQIRDAAELVYSKEYLEEVIYPTLFDGYVIPGMGEVKIARYLEDDEWIYQSVKEDALYSGIIVYDYSSMKIVAPSDANACYVEMNAWMENTPDQVKSVRIRLVSQDGAWFLDSFTGGAL